MKRLHVLLILLVLAVCVIPFRDKVRSVIRRIVSSEEKRKSIDERVAEFGEIVHRRLAPRFHEIGVPYPPKNMVLVGLKKERTLEIWVADQGKNYRLLKTYPILGASGTLGPKLAEGDLQVPEGLYRIESLNPNSLYHLSLRVNYPNEFDQKKGAADGRTDLGSDIMIHGRTASIGCLAMGDEAAEDLFILAAKTGVENIEVVLSPVDFRVCSLPADLPKLPTWAPELHSMIRERLLTLKP